jgi:hypothetical protein
LNSGGLGLTGLEKFGRPEVEVDLVPMEEP